MERCKKVSIRYWLFGKGWVVILPIILGILGIWVWPNLDISPVLTIDVQGNIKENTQTLYLLSSIAQSLAAILALVFMLSLMIFQLSSRYSQRLYAKFFNKFTIIYIVLFVISVFLPLWTIAQPYPYLVKISLSLAAVCLFLLIPYFFNLKEQLSPEKTIGELYNKSLKIVKGRESKLPDEITAIDNFVMSAYAFKDYETCRIAVEALARLAYEADIQWQDDEYYESSTTVANIYEILLLLLWKIQEFQAKLFRQSGGMLIEQLRKIWRTLPIRLNTAYLLLHWSQ